jgi:acyl-CoA synthetase (AMP-forming)/AMP-acid ligase II/acyl carrier protein
MSGHDPRFLLHAQFEEQAKRTPDRVALYHGDRSITFADLKARSDRIAAALRSRGIRDGRFVGLHMERSIDYVTSVLGVLKANNAVVPLPPSYPEGRLRDILSFAALDAVSDDDATPLSPLLGGSVVDFSDLSSGAGAEESAPPGSCDQPAFVLCSLGSTGTPKMIVRSHRSFFHRLNWTWGKHPYASGEVCCQKAYMTTTHAIYELFEPLLRGTPVVIIPDQEVRNLELFWETITRRRISRLLIVPSVLQASLDMPGFVAPPITVLVLMGEYVHPGLAGRAVRAFPEQTQLFSIYGSTEASSTLVCDLRASFRPGEELPLGTPISPDVRAHVLGTDLAPVAPGDAGMLYVGGPALFKEYLKDPALTASVLVGAPEGAGNLYNSHDQVRLTPDGSLQFVGRVDDTVKIRGFRVDLQEVERTLLLHPGISQGAVLTSESGAGSAMLLAFYTPATVDQASVYQALRDRLPAYMVPSVLVGLSALPRTPSGKIDRRRLLEDYASRAVTAQSRDLSETEARVTRVWKDVLKHGDIRLDSSFFEVGGTSLTVFAALHRLREAFGLDRTRLSDQSLYQFPTVADLASYIDSVKRGDAPLTTARNAVLVNLKMGADRSLPPFFVIAPSGGTLGAYEKLARALEDPHAVGLE